MSEKPLTQLSPNEFREYLQETDVTLVHLSLAIGIGYMPDIKQKYVKNKGWHKEYMAIHMQRRLAAGCDFFIDNCSVSAKYVYEVFGKNLSSQDAGMSMYGSTVISIYCLQENVEKVKVEMLEAGEVILNKHIKLTYDKLRQLLCSLHLKPNKEADHRLKCTPEYYDAYKSGLKMFEVRKDDRKFLEGQILCLAEWDPAAERYTGSESRCLISYILRNYPHVEESYVVLGTIPLD